MEQFMDMLPVILLLGAPLLVPLSLKKWAWAATVAIGYALYILWGVLLHFTADITEYGTAYGILILPYLIFITIIGAFVQKWAGKRRKAPEHNGG